MRTRIVVVVLAGVGALSGCRDFSVPSPGNMGPLQVSQSSLHVAPQETAEIQVWGGKPPYTVARPGSSGGDYVGFSLSSESGGWAYLDGKQAIAYTAGQNGGGIDDTFVVKDSAGAKADVKVSIGAPLALEIGDGSTPTPVVPAGGTTFLGATGGKPPYLFGLASAPSDGLVDTVSGRYRAGPVGCTTDTVEVRDAIGVTAIGTVHVACPPMPGSPDRVIAAFPADPLQNGTQQMIYVTSHGSSGGMLTIPGVGGTSVGIPLPGTPVAAAAPRGSSYAVVAVEVPFGVTGLSAGVHVFRVLLSAGATPEDLFIDDAGVTYPVTSTNVDLVTDEAFSGSLSSQVIVELTNGTQQTVDLFDAQNFQIAGPPTPVPVGETSSVTAPIPTGPGRAGWIHVATATTGTNDAQWFAGTTLGGATGSGLITLGLDQIIAVAGGIDGATGSIEVAVVGSAGGDPSNRTVRFLDMSFPAAGAVTAAVRPETLTLPADTRLIGSGPFNGSVGRQFFVVDPQGGTQILFDDGLGYASLPLSWHVPPDSTSLLVTDVDGDGQAEALVAGGPGGAPATFVDPGAIPVAGLPTRGIYGAGPIDPGAVTIRPGRTSEPAIVGRMRGLDASGAPSMDFDDAVVIPAGIDLGNPIPLPIGPAGHSVSAVAAARLQTSSSGADPQDLVAAVDDNTLRAITSEHEGLLDPATVISSATGTPLAPSWLATVPLADDPSREAVLTDTSTGGGLGAVLAPNGTKLEAVGPMLTGTINNGSLAPGRYIDSGTVPTSVPLATPVQVAPNRWGFSIYDVSVGSAGTINVPASPLVFVTSAAIHTWQPYVIGPDPAKGNGFVILTKQNALATLDVVKGSGPCTFIFPFQVADVSYAGKSPDGAGYVFYVLHSGGTTVARVVVLGAGIATLVRDIPLSVPAMGLAAGDLVGADTAPDLVAGGLPLTVLPGLPGAFDAGGTALTCQ